MAEEYKNAAEAAGHKVTLVNVSRKKIAGCLACEYCHNKGNGACIQKDDMQELYPLMVEAEVLVLAAPLLQTRKKKFYEEQKDRIEWEKNRFFNKVFLKESTQHCTF